MTHNINDAIEAVEKQFISEQKTFTAVDVGNELKRSGKNVRQRDVSPIIRAHYKTDLYGDQNYTRTMIPVRNGTTQAYLYFNIDEKPEKYTDSNQDVLPWDPTTPVPQYDITTKNDGKEDSDGTQKADDNPAPRTDDGCTRATITTHIQLDGLVGSVRSDIYHTSDCPYARRIKQENRTPFTTEKVAQSSHYRKCKRE